MNSPNQPFFVMDRPPRLMISLPSKEDADYFLDNEEKLWSWIDNDFGHPFGYVTNLVNRYRPQNWIQNFRNALNRELRDEFNQLMHTRYGSSQCLCYLDPEAQPLRVLGETDKVVGMVALTVIHGEVPMQDQNFMRSDPRNRIGVAHGYSLLSGINSSSVAGTQRELQDARTAIELESQRMRALVSKSNDDWEANADLIRVSAHTLQTSHDEAFSKSETERSEAYAKLRDELEGTRKAFEVQMELQAPVSYWRTRAAQYRKASNWTLALLLAFAASSIYLLYRLYEIAAMHLPADAATVPYAALFKSSAFALLMTSIVFWAGRVLLRIYLSTRHLATDAEERRTMITTFLALTKKSVLKDEDRKFILAPLFRPGADGIVNEESAPDTMFAALLGSVLKK